MKAATTTTHSHQPTLDDGTVVTHTHDHAEPLHETETRRIAVEQDLMAKNDRAAALNRARFEASGTFVVDLMSSPGRGKTTLVPVERSSDEGCETSRWWST